MIKNKKKQLKKKFVTLVNAYNKASASEHENYMNRHMNSFAGEYDDPKKAKRDLQIMSKINKEFVRIFGKLIPRKDRKNFNLGYYDTHYPEEMADLWLEDI